MKQNSKVFRIGVNMFLQKNCVRFDIPRIINNCPNSILDKINNHSIQIYKNTFFTNVQGKLHYSGLLCMQ